MTTLGFENYVNPLKVYLNKYREIEVEKVGEPIGDSGIREFEKRYDDGYYAPGAQVSPYSKIGDGNRVMATTNTQFILGSSGRF